MAVLDQSTRVCNEPIPVRIDENGMKVVTIYDDQGRPHPKSVAEIILETMVGPRPSPDHRPRHKDGDRDNCAVSNLEWSPNPRPVRVDDQGRIFEISGEQFILPGLEPEKVQRSLAEVDEGLGRPFEEVLNELRGR